MNWTEQDLQNYHNRQMKHSKVAVISEPHDKLNARGRGLVLEKVEKPLEAKSVRLKQTKCEMEYGRMLSMEFPGVPVIPWGITLRMMNGHKYTPDFAVLLDKILLVEVKQRGRNGFRQHSYQRAKLAYDQVKFEYPQFDYRWSEKSAGAWNSH